MAVTERIKIIFEAISKVTKPVQQTQKQLKQLELQTQAYQNVAANANISLRKSKQFFRDNNLVMKDSNTAVSQLTGRTRSLGEVTEGAKRSAKRFNFAWLSVMFAGMALNRVFGGMIKAQLQLFGITQLFSGVLTVLMLPVMMLLLPLFLKLANFFLNLPDGVKTAIGIFIILGAIFGIILLVVGQVMLAVAGFASLFGGSAVAGVILGAISAVVASLGTILIVIAIIIAIVIAMVVAWKENFLGMKEIVHVFIESVKSIFKGAFNILKGIIKFFVALFKGDFEGVKEAVVLIFKGLVQLITGLIMALVTAIAAIIVGIIRAFWGIIQTIWGYWKWIFHKLVGGSLIPDLVNAIIDWFWKLPGNIMDALKSILSKVFDWGMDFIKNMGDGIKSMASKFKDSLLSIFPSWARSGIWSGGKMVIDIFKNVTERVRRAFGGGKSKRAGDFILRPGGDLIKTDPRDTIIGFKGRGPNLGGQSKGMEIIINNTNTFNVSDKQEFQKMLDDNNSKIVEDIKRQISL